MGIFLFVFINYFLIYFTLNEMYPIMNESLANLIECSIQNADSQQ